MKIGLVLENFDPHQGGLEHWSWQFAGELLRRGHEVQVIAFEFHPASSALGVVQHFVPRPASRLARAAALEAALRLLSLDVIHDMGVGWFADIFHPHGGSTVATWEHNLLRIPRWRQFRLWREKRYREMRRIERLQHASTGFIVAVSEMVRRHFEKLHEIPTERLRVIYNGVDTERFQPAFRSVARDEKRRELGVAEDEMMFLLLAHNWRLKNAETLIRATARLVSAGCRARAVIAGARKLEPWRLLAEKCGASQAVTLLEPADDPGPLYAASDVYVQPTWYDPCSLVTLEAWACGLPVITTRYNGASELMRGDSHGVVLNSPADVGELANALRQMSNHQQRLKIRGSARELACAHSFARQTDEFLRLYDEVIHAKNRLA